MTMENHKDLIEKLTKEKGLVILVLDEVDNMISARRSTPENELCRACASCRQIQAASFSSLELPMLLT